MEKITKTYVSKLIFGREWQEEEVNHTDPELINTEDCTAFMFQEQSTIIDGEDTYVGEIKTISPRYHIGTRISLTEALKMRLDAMTRTYIEKSIQNGIDISICLTDDGLIQFMTAGDVTLEEYKNNKHSLS